MFRLVLGLVKGAVLGGGAGYGAWHLGLGGGWAWIVYGAVGLVVGLLVGRPFWSHAIDPKSTIWTSVMKGIFGVGVAIGLYALARYAAGNPTIELLGEARPLVEWWPGLCGAIGALYGAWVEVDDPPRRRAKKASASSSLRDVA
jgi:hypothetical protein